MKQLIILVSCVLCSVFVNAQTTDWSGIPTKQNSIGFGNIAVFSDTIGFNSGSGVTYGQFLKVDSLEDGKYYMTTASVVSETDSAYILQSISDTAAVLRTRIADSTASLRAALADSTASLRAALADSTLWMVGAAGDFVKLQETSHTVVLGAENKVSANSSLEVTGPLLLLPVTVNSEPSTNIGAESGNVFIITSTTTTNDTIVSIVQAQAGQIIHITNSDLSNSVYMSPYAFTNTSSQSLDTPGDSNVVIGPKDVVGILCVSDVEFRIISVIDNQ